MIRRDRLTKGLAVGGTLLVWFPVLTPIVLALLSLLVEGRLLFDYLMPAELGLVALAGGVALLAGALRGRARVRPVAWFLGIAIASPLVGQTAASLSGLASGRIEPAGPWWGFVVAMLAVYTVALVALGVTGIMLVRDLARAPDHRPDNS